MPSRRSAAAKKTTTRTVRSPRKKKVAVEIVLPSPEEAYGVIVEACRDLWKRIQGGVLTPADREALDKARQRAQALKDAYPALWEKACHEVET